MKKLTTLFTTAMIALALLLAAPAAIAGKGHSSKGPDWTAVERLAKCRAAIANPNSAMWYGSPLGACMAFGQADKNADKKRGDGSG